MSKPGVDESTMISDSIKASTDADSMISNHPEENTILVNLIDLDRVVRAGQPNGTLTQHFLAAMDLETLILMMTTSSLFNFLGNQPQVWQAMINQYFPYLKNIFLHEYRDSPKVLFIQEYDNVMYLMNSFGLGAKVTLAALSGDFDMVNELEKDSKYRLNAYSLMLANGCDFVMDRSETLEAERLQTELNPNLLQGLIDDKADPQIPLMQMRMVAIGFAAMFGYQAVFDNIMQLFTQEKSLKEDAVLNILAQSFNYALLNGSLNMAVHIVELYRQTGKLTHSVLKTFLETALFEANNAGPIVLANPVGHISAVHSLAFLSTFKDEIGNPIIVSLLYQFLHLAVLANDLKSVKFLLELEVNQFKKHSLIRDTMRSSLSNSSNEIFIYLYETYGPVLFLSAQDLHDFMHLPNYFNSDSFEIIDYLSELRDENGNLINEDCLPLIYCLRHCFWVNSLELAKRLMTKRVTDNENDLLVDMISLEYFNDVILSGNVDPTNVARLVLKTTKSYLTVCTLYASLLHNMMRMPSEVEGQIMALLAKIRYVWFGKLEPVGTRRPMAWQLEDWSLKIDFDAFNDMVLFFPQSALKVAEFAFTKSPAAVSRLYASMIQKMSTIPIDTTNSQREQIMSDFVDNTADPAQEVDNLTPQPLLRFSNNISREANSSNYSNESSNDERPAKRARHR